MANELLINVFFLFWYFLTILAVLFILSGLDDLFFDIYYWTRYLIRLWKTRDYDPLSYEQLVNKEEQMIAVLVPCWHEAGVIGTMLRHNCYSIDYSNYYFFVGVYPNDPATINEVEEISKLIKNVQCVIGKTPGPTNKASNLNGVYEHVREFEKTLDKPFSIFVFHDSEDIIHPLSFKLYNYLIPRKDMIQIPVFPLKVKYRNFTHWLYADEFSENHTKDIIVRESIQGHVPSAGVGTAFSRHALKVLEDPETQTPFATNSLTEDYRTSLTIRVRQLKQIFVTQRITKMKWQKKSLFRKGYIQKPVKEYVATRALFPLEYKKAVRQKARWIIGIVFQEWQHTQWPKEWRVKFTLAHDRKAFFTHFINGFGYFVFLFWLLYSCLTYNSPQYPSLQEQLNNHSWVWWLIVAVTFIMLERMIQRMIAVRRVYQSWIPALLSIPRTFYGNLLNLHALIRAYKVYYSTPLVPQQGSQTAQPVWDKTDHHFPGSHILTPFKLKIGDLLLNNNLITKDNLNLAVLEQQKTGDRLGAVLERLNLITPDILLQLLSEQYNLPLYPLSSWSNISLPEQCLSKRALRWLVEHQVLIIDFNEKKQKLTLGISDPTNELLIEQTINRTAPYITKFVLIDPNN